MTTATKAKVAVVRLSGGYADLAEGSGSLMDMLGGGGTPKPFYELEETLRGLGEAEGATILLDLSANPRFNLPQIAELARVVQGWRAAGKTVHAYLEQASLGEYQLASQCDKVWIADMGMIDLRSLAMSVTFLKDAMDLVGVQMDVVRCGDFKGAVEPFMLSQMSDHLRSHYRDMLASMNDSLVQRIAAGRRLAADQVRELQAQRLFVAEAALAAGLVDGLVPYAGGRAALKHALGSDDFEAHDALDKKKKSRSFNPMTMFAELFSPPKDRAIDEASVVVLHLSGAIADGHADAAGSIVSGPAVERIRKLRDNEAVKGVVVRINSPGGSATASEAILLALQELSTKKPVVVSMGDVAASGGYYVTCFGKKVFAEAGTITGSIGVFGMKPNAGALMRRVGVRQEAIALDEAATMDALDRGWSDGQKQRIQTLVDGIYDRFIAHVARSRGLERQAVLALAGGRVWSGAQAKAHGLVDELGGLHDAVAAVIAEAELAPDVEIRHEPAPRSMFASLFDSMNASAGVLGLADASLLAQLERLGAFGASCKLLLRSAQPGLPQVWAMLPADLNVR